MNARTLLRRCRRSQIHVPGRWYLTIVIDDRDRILTGADERLRRALYCRVQELDGLCKSAHLSYLLLGRPWIEVALRIEERRSHVSVRGRLEATRAIARIRALVVFLRRHGVRSKVVIG